MKFNSYLVIHRIIVIFQYTIFPILWVLRPVIPFLSERSKFETKNQFNPSFKDEGVVADYCFHVSSEGELEQCLVIIDHFLKNSKRVELVYTSPSVERKCRLLDENHKNLLSFRMPLLTFPVFSFRRWVSAKILFMCRYDFFSELMLYGARDDVSFYLLSATLKGKEDKGVFKSYLSREKFNLYDGIFTGSSLDMKRFQNLGVSSSLEEYEFRLLQIAKRVQKAEETLKAQPNMAPLVELLESRDRESNIIIGSAWPIEMDILRSSEFVEKIRSGELLVCIAPHSLNKFAINEIKTRIREITRAVEIHTIGIGEFPSQPAIYINPTPGVLCESFKLFSHCLIGGGHGRSIHSVLEPYLAFGMVYTGPKTHRSTEFDFIKSHSPDCIEVIDDLSSFYEKLKHYNREKELIKRVGIVDNYKDRFLTLMDDFKC